MLAVHLALCLAVNSAEYLESSSVAELELCLELCSVTWSVGRLVGLSDAYLAPLSVRQLAQMKECWLAHQSERTWVRQLVLLALVWLAMSAPEY
jgi:hypothetical protein